MKQSKLQKAGAENPPRENKEARPPAPIGKKGEAMAAYAEKWNREPKENFAAHCVKENTLQELETNHQPEHADEVDCEQWELTPEEWSDAIKAAIAEKRLAQQHEGDSAPDAKDSKPPQKKEESQSDLLTEFQTLEWHAITLAATQMDEAEKKVKLDAIRVRLAETADKLKQGSLKKFGISPITVETRLAMAGKLIDDILRSDERYPIIAKSNKDKSMVQAAMRSFEANEWKMLEQATRAKNAAQTPNAAKREKEQGDLFKSAHQYAGAASGLAHDSEVVGIPKQVVQKRAEQRLNHLGEDPDLSEMRNPTREAYRLSGAAVLATYIKELIENLAKTIKRLIEQAQASRANTNATPPKMQSSEIQDSTQPRTPETAPPIPKASMPDKTGPLSRADKGGRANNIESDAVERTPRAYMG